MIVMALFAFVGLAPLNMKSSSSKNDIGYLKYSAYAGFDV